VDADPQGHVVSEGPAGMTPTPVQPKQQDGIGAVADHTGQPVV
jgi:hypothetical protein